MARHTPRSERGTAVLLIVLSALFVVAGAFLWFVGGVPIGLICLFFFGGCLVAGVTMLVGPDTTPGRILVIAGALGMGAGCALMAGMAIAGVPLGPRMPTGLVIPIGAIGGFFFGGGGILLLVRLIRGPRHRIRGTR